MRIGFFGGGGGSGGGGGAIDTFLISGGLSSDTLTDLAIDKVEPSTFRIDGVDLSYGGDTDVIVPANMTNGKVYLYDNGGVGDVGVGAFAPTSSIIIATFDSDATKITSYNLSGNFAVTTEVNKLIEKVNHVVVGKTTNEVVGDEVTFTWAEQLKVYLPSMAAGPGVVNYIEPTSVTLAQNEVAFVTVIRENNATITVQKMNIFSADFSSDTQILFFNDVSSNIINLVDGGGDTTFTIPEPSVIKVGGISVGTTFNNATLGEFVDMLLYPELFGTLTNPSSTFVSSVTGFKEIGEEIATINFNTSFNRGSINPQYQSDEPFRSGLPSEFIFTGVGLNNQIKTDLTDSQTINNYTVILGTQSWTGRVSYSQGVQPKGSKGTEFNTPLTAGQTNNITRTITGVYPVFATTSNITTMTKQALANHGAQLTIDLVGESGSNKQTIQVPNVWGVLTALEQWNPLSSSWDSIPTSTFTESTITKDIQGNTINYRQYTHNDGLIGARRLRFTF